VRIPSDRQVGMSQLYERAVRAEISRRQFVRHGAVAVAGLAGLEALRAAPAFAKKTPTAAPKPIPGGFKLPTFDIVPTGADIHVLPPVPGLELSTITDFNGQVAAAEIGGNAVGSDGSSWTFDTDMRVMQGEYIGADGQHHNGTFGFI
jgi:hypothetical protein